MVRWKGPVVALLITGCANVLEPPVREEDRPLQTDRLAYEVRRDGVELRTEIPFTYTNRTGKTVYVVSCDRNVPPVLEKRVDGEWLKVWSAIVPRCLSDPIVIEPGQTYADTLRMYGVLPGNNMAPEFEAVEIEGTYRLVWWGLVHDYDPNRQDFGEPLPLEERTSNSFLLTED